MTATRWHATCPATWPTWARDWACTAGSLTVRLKSLQRGFEVEPLVQGLATVSPRTVPGGRAARRTTLRQRLVRLKVGGQVVVLAQTVMALNGTACDWPFWSRLGKRSLGSVLFTDPLVRRGRLRFAQLPVGTPWIQQLLHADPECTGLPLDPNVDVNSMRTVYARCARFERRPGRTPLWVMEVFLPTLTLLSRTQHECVF